MTQEISTREAYDRFDAMAADGKSAAASEMESEFEALIRGIEKHEFANIYPNLRNEPGICNDCLCAGGGVSRAPPWTPAPSRR